jgi:hypothetical protein
VVGSPGEAGLAVLVLIGSWWRDRLCWAGVPRGAERLVNQTSELVHQVYQGDDVAQRQNACVFPDEKG